MLTACTTAMTGTVATAPLLRARPRGRPRPRPPPPCADPTSRSARPRTPPRPTRAAPAAASPASVTSRSASRSSSGFTEAGAVRAVDEPARPVVDDQVARVARVDGDDARATRHRLRAAGCRRSTGRQSRGKRRRRACSASRRAAAPRRRTHRRIDAQLARQRLEPRPLLAVADDHEQRIRQPRPHLGQRPDRAVDALPRRQPRRRQHHERAVGGSTARSARGARASAAGGRRRSRSRPVAPEPHAPFDAGLRRASTSSPCVPSSVMMCSSAGVFSASASS